MPGSLFDTSVWLAAIFPTHPFHTVAQQALLQATSIQPAIWCRATQQSFLRLVSTPTLHKAYGVEHMNNQDALLALDSLQALAQVNLQEEPPGTFALWRNLAALETASPKVWMDAYLAAFAIAGGLSLVSLDRDFKNFVPQGLELVLL